MEEHFYRKNLFQSGFSFNMLFFMTVFTKIDFLNVLLETIQEFRFFDNYLIGMKRLINPVNFNIQNTMFMPLQIGINSFTSLVMFKMNASLNFFR